MGINVSTSMGFENQAFLKNAAQNILQKSGVHSEKAEEFVNTTLFENLAYTNSSNVIFISTSAQIALNNSLKETLKYLKAHAKDKKKTYVLGELWDDFISNQDENETESYSGELFDYEIDKNLKNIFAA